MANPKRIISVSRSYNDTDLCNLVITEGQIKVAIIVVPVSIVGDIISCNL